MLAAQQSENTKRRLQRRALLLVLLALLGGSLFGCASPNAQVQRIQGEKDKLLATIQQQRDSNRTLQTQVASLEDRLDEAETIIAGGKPRSSMTRTATAPITSSQSLASSSPPRKPAVSAPPENDPLPWRPHRIASKSPAALPALAELARQDDRIQIDPETGAGVWTGAIGFEKNSAALTADSRQQLSELAKVLQRSPASKFRVMVATSAERTGSRTQESANRSGRPLATSRAQSVADYLDRHGLAEERLAIASTGLRKTPRDEHGNALAASGDVRIYLVDPDQPVLGWLSEGSTLRR
jgi:outer membrane protein OmpA-like peptidoglycan-associated protein